MPRLHAVAMTNARKFGVLVRLVLLPLLVFTFAGLTALGALWAAIAGNAVTWSVTFDAGVVDGLFGLAFAVLTVFGVHAWGQGLTISEGSSADE